MFAPDLPGFGRSEKPHRILTSPNWHSISTIGCRQSGWNVRTSWALAWRASRRGYGVALALQCRLAHPRGADD